MVQASGIYKVIGIDNYETLIKERIIPKSFIVETFGTPISIQKVTAQTGINIEKLIKLKLEKGDNTITDEYKDIAIDKFIDKCMKKSTYTCINNTNKNNKFDLIIGEYLIDIKCSKKAKFGKSDIASFILQLSKYYCYLDDVTRKKIKYIAIYNPLANIFMYANVSDINVKKFKSVLNFYDIPVTKILSKKYKFWTFIGKFFKFI